MRRTTLAGSLRFGPTSLVRGANEIFCGDRITPVPDEMRTDKRLYQFFFVWFSANANILT